MNANLINEPVVREPETSPAASVANYLSDLETREAPISAPPTSETLAERAPSSGFPPPPAGAPPFEREARSRRGPGRYLLVALILLFALLGGAGGGILGARLFPAQTATTSGQTVKLSASVADLQQAVENVSQGVQPSVVKLTSNGLVKSVIGSGVILTKDGYIVTNDHVVFSFTDFTVTLSNGTSLPARMVGQDVKNDLAVLKVDANDLTPITFADSSMVKVGQFVVALGAPIGLENTATFGIVSALDRKMSELPDGLATDLTGLIQTDITLNPGNSGGALLDLQGRLIGIPTMSVAATPNDEDVDNIAFSIPSNLVKSVTTQLIQNGNLAQ